MTAPLDNTDNQPQASLSVQEQLSTENTDQASPIPEHQPSIPNMEVHHHTHHPKKWKEYFWEFFMLFLAVFCGFIAEIQVEHYIEHQRERQYLKNLVNELEQDIVTLDHTIAEISENVHRLDTLIKIIGANEQQTKKNDLYYLARIASRLGTLSINDFTIQQLKYSGGFRLIRHVNVAKEIQKHYSKLDIIQKLYGIDIQEASDYRMMALSVFDPIVFDGLITPNNTVMRPLNSPAYLTNDTNAFKRIAGMAAYMKNTRKSLTMYETDFKSSARALIALIQKEYSLSL
jgi:hypothetical protein